MSRRRSRRHVAPGCTACGVRDNTIEVQRVLLVALRRRVGELHAVVEQAEARRDRLAQDTVQTLHDLFTLPLAEYAAEHFEQLGGDPDEPQRRRDYALALMAECAGLELNQRVVIAYTPDGADGPVTVPGRVRDARLDADGEPVLLVALDNRSDTATLVAAGYDLAPAEPTGVLAGLLLLAVPFPARSRRIADGGWIEARP
ncbi:hypothetical protein [Kribbella sp. NPDC023855]|uniref:hypothetical protein n=1 Tax=Kribbella sp. NPDC023855 TaxID=3154698 RepID=UPI0033DC35F5